MKPLVTIVVLVLLLVGCTEKFLTSNRYTNEQIPLTIVLPASKNAVPHKQTTQRFAKKRFNKHAAMLTPELPPQILFYSGGNDNPDQVPYTAIGSLISAVDTAKIKSSGFASRKINNQPYLHKTTIDKANRVVSSEYLVKTPSDYFYLFASAPINKAIRQNEEAMIVLQDSLNRKYSAAIGTLTFQK